MSRHDAVLLAAKSRLHLGRLGEAHDLVGDLVDALNGEMAAHERTREERNTLRANLARVERARASQVAELHAKLGKVESCEATNFAEGFDAGRKSCKEEIVALFATDAARALFGERKPGFPFEEE